MAHIDDLTQLYNRRAFVSAMDRTFKQAERYGRPLSLLILDVDNLKQINDTLGHSAGNTVLMSVAAALAQSMRETDFVCRLHGDEFGVIMPETEKEGCMAAGSRVSEILSKQQPLARMRDRSMKATISCGGACFPADASTTNELFDKADAALYEAKRTGKNRVLMWDDLRASKE